MQWQLMTSRQWNTSWRHFHIVEQPDTQEAWRVKRVDKLQGRRVEISVAYPAVHTGCICLFTFEYIVPCRCLLCCDLWTCVWPLWQHPLSQVSLLESIQLPAQWTGFSVVCTLNTVHWTQYTVHCTFYTVHCTLYSVHFTLYTIHCTRTTVHCALYTAQCTQCTVHSCTALGT